MRKTTNLLDIVTDQVCPRDGVWTVKGDKNKVEEFDNFMDAYWYAKGLNEHEPAEIHLTLKKGKQ